MPRRRRGLPLAIILVLIALAAWQVFRHLAPPRPANKTKTKTNEREARAGSPQVNPPVGEGCSSLSLSCSSQYFVDWNPPQDGKCRTQMSHGFPIPDPRCTPGGINPTVSVSVMRDAAWRTRCVRNCETSESVKRQVYGWYSVIAPRRNRGESQICELDHLVPLELGGADGLGNIWPQCGPDDASLDPRFFRQKDRVESFLVQQVKAGCMSLQQAQREIAEDWTQFLDQTRSSRGEVACQ